MLRTDILVLDIFLLCRAPVPRDVAKRYVRTFIYEKRHHFLTPFVVVVTLERSKLVDPGIYFMALIFQPSNIIGVHLHLKVLNSYFIY